MFPYPIKSANIILTWQYCCKIQKHWDKFRKFLVAFISFIHTFCLKVGNVKSSI